MRALYRQMVNQRKLNELGETRRADAMFIAECLRWARDCGCNSLTIKHHPSTCFMKAYYSAQVFEYRNCKYNPRIRYHRTTNDWTKGDGILQLAADVGLIVEGFSFDINIGQPFMINDCIFILII